MPEKTKPATQGAQPGARRRPRHTRAARAMSRQLDGLSATPANTATIGLLADLLGVWARRMIVMNPTAAGHVYRACLAAWMDAREARGGYDSADPHEREAGAYHTAVMNRLGELFGGDDHEANIFDRERSAALAALMRPEVEGVLARVELAVAPGGETTPACADIDPDPWDELGKEFEDFLDELGKGTDGD